MEKNPTRASLLPKGRVYPLSIPERKAMEDYIKEALQQQFICPSTSPAPSSFFFVGKKDGGLRPCIDYRTLNDHTVKLPYPLPLVLAALEELRGARIFSKLDLRSAYNLVRIQEGDEWKTVFNTPSGHYEYRVMPYGLSNSPSVFQGFMNEVFREFFHRFVIVYIDNILGHVQAHTGPQRFATVLGLNDMFPGNGLQRCATGLRYVFSCLVGVSKMAAQSAATCI